MGGRPASVAETLRDPKVFQLTHGVCPICLAGRLTSPFKSAIEHRPATTNYLVLIDFP